jgi:glycosyltransferase involved in cell wall biosynthesis
MTEQPLVSVAMCTYNGEKFINLQLDSILAQTYHNLELVIVDDGSTDETFNIISDYAKKDGRIKCFKNEVNLGFNKNYERAIKLTTGEFIAISDQDDIWLPHKMMMMGLLNRAIFCSGITLPNTVIKGCYWLILLPGILPFSGANL